LEIAVPLIKSGSKRARNANIKTLVGEVGESPHVKSVKQAVAIAYSEQRRHGGGGKKSHLNHEHVSKWTRGERKDYR
jgi:hypothetical protein